MITKHRQWTETEKQKLLKDYFERLPGTCPACGHPVRMMTHHEVGAMTLRLRCDCGNKASVTCYNKDPKAVKALGEASAISDWSGPVMREGGALKNL